VEMAWSSWLFKNFFADSKGRAKSSNDVSIVICEHQTWDLEGAGGQFYPPPAFSGFQVPHQV